MNKCPHMVWKESNECSKEAAWYKIFGSSLKTDQKEQTALVTALKQTALVTVFKQTALVTAFKQTALVTAFKQPATSLW